ncbi:histidine kinase [filamentous cyanobacterium CCP5]|nr:histidine kinase [filamentous cyanobacterium CCP5]
MFANDYFYQLAGVVGSDDCQGTRLLESLAADDQRQLAERYRRHILQGILNAHFGEAAWIDDCLLHEPVIVTLGQKSAPVRRLELRIRGTEAEQCRVYNLQDDLVSALLRCWKEKPTASEVMAQLYDPHSPLNSWIAELRPGRYQAEGYLLLEGTDVTERELVRDLIELVVNQESVLEPQKFQAANRLIKPLFRAHSLLILSAEQDQVRLFLDLEQPEWQAQTFSVHEFQATSFFAVTAQGQVVNVADLEQVAISTIEQQIAARGVRSLLLIPLVAKTASSNQQRLLGLMGIASSQPYAFNQADCCNATTLIPALSAAMRHGVRESFTNIHPSVRWRFEQEAERRSWGLPAQAITFENVCPLYGISDIRGSSEERNCSIQADLVQQFTLALAVIDAVAAAMPIAFIEQLRLDLQERLETLYQGITVESEVTLLHYLQHEVETHFDYFGRCGPEAAAAIATYRAALDPEQGCVYQARARYDHTINSINELLRQTWSQWQQAMQQITPHYCDVEATDGIDHMIYAGKSIDSQFTDFHLHSLRYEQLRAVCACAQAAYSLKDRYDSDLVVTHLVLVQATKVDITHDEHTERLFDVRGTRDTRYEIVKKRIDKACDTSGKRITQPGMLTIVYSTEEEWQEYQRYLTYLQREQLVSDQLEQGSVEPLQGVSGLRFVRVPVLPATEEAKS